MWTKRFRKQAPLLSYVVAKDGQSTVELLLVFPVFLLIICFVMEIGMLGYQTILAHHGAYELLRIGSMVAGPPGGTKNPTSNMGFIRERAERKMQAVLPQFFRTRPLPRMRVLIEEVGTDPQTKYTHKHYDLKIELTYTARLFFPGSSYFLSKPVGQGTRDIKVSMRMPIEIPVFN